MELNTIANFATIKIFFLQRFKDSEIQEFWKIEIEKSIPSIDEISPPLMQLNIANSA